jgi:hypothetical protein
MVVDRVLPKIATAADPRPGLRGHLATADPEGLAGFTPADGRTEQSAHDLHTQDRRPEGSMTRQYSYSAFGLTIRSAVALPEFRGHSDARPDVVIRSAIVDGPHPKSALAGCLAGCYFHLASREACFFWESVGTFQVRDGKEIVVERAAGAEESLIRLPLLGVVMAVLLHQRGLLVLHGSAVALNDRAVVFLGGKGYGKSTLAATLYGRGHALLADDIVALALGPAGEVLVLPGFPQFKLWPDAAESALGEDPNTLPRLATGYEKRARRVPERFAEGPLQLGAIYTLADGPAVKAERLQAQRALVPLIGHSYAARFGSRLLHGGGAASHLLECTRLVRAVPIYSLERPSALPLLLDAARLVEAQRGDDLRAAD